MSRTFNYPRGVLLIEAVIFVVLMLILLTGRQPAPLDSLGPRADVLLLAATLVIFGLVHMTAGRRVARSLERRFAPAPYDDRKVVFDLTLEARAATDLNQLYTSIARRIADALQTDNVSIFVHDEAARLFVCRVSVPSPYFVAGREREDGSMRPLLAEDAFVVRRLRGLATPLTIEPAEYDAWTRALSTAPRPVREARERERAMLEIIKTNLLVQIKIKDQLVGILSLGPRQHQHTYSDADKEMLMAIAGQLAFVIENSKLIERMVAEERLRRELALAAEVQQRLFPSRPPAANSLELSGICKPASGVGGDYYDFLELSDNNIGVAVADVAGKGIMAALLMSSVQAYLRGQTIAGNANMCDRPAEIVAIINRLLCKSTGAATYATFFYAQFDERSRQLTYVNAGHNPPLLLRGGRAAGCDKLTAGGTVVGLFYNTGYTQETVKLESGDLMAAYTDGVTEALNYEGEEFGEARLINALAATAHLSAEEALASVMRTVQAWCAGMPQHDDITLVLLKVKKLESR